jgi:hypothetical protein
MDTEKTGYLAFVSSKVLAPDSVELIMQNNGMGRFSLKDINLYVNGKQAGVYSGHKSAVMPGQKRRFVIKHSKQLKAEDIRFGQ